MIVPILLCTFLGIFLDRFFHTSFLVIIMFFLGAAAGGRNIYIFARQIFGKPPVHDEVRVRSSNFDESKRITSPHGTDDIAGSSGLPAENKIGIVPEDPDEADREP
jgi:hypothetical protein